MYERQLLKELEALRSDVASAAKKVVSPSTGPPKPKIIPPLEDYRNHPHSAPIPPTTNDGRTTTQPNFPSLNSSQSQQSASSQTQTLPGLDDPLSPTFLIGPQQQPPMAASTPAFASSRTQALPPPNQQTKTAPAQPHDIGSSSYQSPLHAPPLGRFGDGTRIFTQPSVASTSQPITTAPVGLSQTFDPLRSGATPRPTATPSPDKSTIPGQQTVGVDPAAQVRSHQMAQSMHMPLTRPRLDAREAASKLANMF